MKSEAVRIPEKFRAQFWERSCSAVYPDWSLYICCAISFAGRIDENRLRRAVRLTLDAEPIMACRFVEHWFRPHWRRFENLDDIPFCEVRVSSDAPADMRRFIEAVPDLPLHVLLLRADFDVLCLKIDHRLVDGQGMKDYAYLLADIYRCLEGDSRYVPLPNVNGDRSTIQIGKAFGLIERWRIRQKMLKSGKQSRTGRLKWKYPIPPHGPWEFSYSAGKLDAPRVRAIFRYAVRQRATVNQVLVAALYLAICEALPPPDGPLPVAFAIDLRRYLPSKKAPALTNLLGLTTLAIDFPHEKSLDAVVKQIAAQMRVNKGLYLGLEPRFFFFTLPVVRYLRDLIPYWCMKRAGRRLIRSTQKRLEAPVRETHSDGIIMMTDVGDIDPARVVFTGAVVTDAFIMSGVLRMPGMLGCCVSMFKESLTVGLGFGPSALITEIFERMMRLLPSPPAASEDEFLAWRKSG
jgi:NRPS condensation-like uncharacterized protein